GQTAQPLIWLARISTSCCVAAGRAESDSALPAELRYLANLATTGLPKRLRRGSMAVSLSFSRSQPEPVIRWMVCSSRPYDDATPRNVRRRGSLNVGALSRRTG